MADLAGYVGIPWQDKGRDRAGCDCWGLLRLVYAECLGITLPSYGDNYATAADREALHALIAGELGPWIAIPAGSEQTFDGVLTTEGGVIRHVGIVAGNGAMLHMPEGSDSVIASYRSHRYRSRVAGFWRYQGPSSGSQMPAPSMVYA